MKTATVTIFYLQILVVSWWTGKKRIFGGHDLLKVPDDTLPTIIDLTKANSLNRIPLPKQGDTGRDLYIEREEDEPKPERTAKPQQRALSQLKKIL